MYRITGDIYIQNIKELYKIVEQSFSDASIRQKGDEELFIKSPNLDLNFYESVLGSFLIGGFITENKETVEN